jgi:PTH1 family peptidyl-tRNA hydrolase
LRGAEIEGERAVKLVKPQTYMNLSGEAVGVCLRSKAEAPVRQFDRDLDDLALPFGKDSNSSHGFGRWSQRFEVDHRALGTNEFTRLRIGIQPEHPIRIRNVCA